MEEANEINHGRRSSLNCQFHNHIILNLRIKICVLGKNDNFVRSKSRDDHFSQSMSSSGVLETGAPAAKMSWEVAAKNIRETIDNAIPKKWKLQRTLKDRAQEVRDIPRTCGLLSLEELQITEQTATDLVKKLASGELSSSQVVEAFCARAAVAHQLVGFIPTFIRFTDDCGHSLPLLG